MHSIFLHTLNQRQTYVYNFNLSPYVRAGIPFRKKKGKAKKMGDFTTFQAKMEAEGLSWHAITAFKNCYEALVSGASGMIEEDTIVPASGLPTLESDITGKVQINPQLLKETVVLKLNGGLGTSMGLDKAKSLLNVKAQNTFLDLTAKQCISMRDSFQSDVRFMLMNSFSTSQDTLKFLEKYPELIADPNLELMQNKVPKVDVSTLQPAVWPLKPSTEWCPPGHGDLYAALAGSSKLDKLLAEGMKYMFVSNSDNLGATLDLELLSYFAESGAPFIMECCERTENDKKGGHLATRKSDNQLILRESAQCAATDEAMFQDITRHRYFNTNNLWIRLDKLKEAIDSAGGLIPLPMIKNSKTVDPQNAGSTPVFQLETAMGAAIECFAGASAVVVPRSRFAPVKKCDDLFLLRSDAYILTSDYRPVLAPERNGVAPIIELDSKKYKFVQQLEEATLMGIPSLLKCNKLKVEGAVYFNSRISIEGSVTVINRSQEPKMLPPGVYSNTTIDLTAAPGLGPLKSVEQATAPIPGQKPGTSGLRKPTRVFMEGYYLHNFVQACFDALKAEGTDLTGTLVIGGDGRYYNPEAIQVILKIAVANGVRRFWIGQNGFLSTPATSAVIRERGPVYKKAFGAFILTASHNPGGPDEDFGIKYNCENGGPAPERLTDLIYQNTTTMTKFKWAQSFPEISVQLPGVTRVESTDGFQAALVEVIDCTEDHVNLLKSIFDFTAIRTLLNRPDFSMVYDCMSGVQGPYAKAVFCSELGQDESCLIAAVPLNDFGGGHADPNLTYAHRLTEVMGVDRTGLPITGQATEPPQFGAAADGDADRNMILGQRFFVTPSDSVAIIAAHANVIPFFRDQGGLKGVARSMPTSGALDRVAERLNLKFFETPTGWKFFGNLMDSKLLGGENFSPFICGEESFGTGSDHIREKDGMWAVLAWLQILAHYNAASSELVTVEKIVNDHWKTYGRNYYCRYDYEGVDSVCAQRMMKHMISQFPTITGQEIDGFKIAKADEFEYTDPVDRSVSSHQGVRILMEDGSRIIFRLSGTAGSGATIRMYLEKYEGNPELLNQVTADAMQSLVQLALKLSNLAEITGRSGPTVIT